MISKRFKYDGAPHLRLNQIQLASKVKIEENINKGRYKFENINCQICNSDNFEILTQKDRYGLAHQVVICKNCGLVYTNPRMTQKSYSKFYNSEYRKLYGGRNAPNTAVFYSYYERGKRIYKYVGQYLPTPKNRSLNILEIGCGAGGILLFFKENGCNVLGLDLDEQYLQFGRDNFGLDLRYGTLDKLPDGFTPDVIIYSHVLEHILDLNLELKKVKKICSSKTIIYIEVPGIQNIHRSYKMDALLYFQNAHTFHFSQNSLLNLFKKHCFNLIIGDEFVRCIFTKGQDQDNQPLMNEYKPIIDYLSKTERFKSMFPFKISTIKMKVALILKSIKCKQF
ncbi:class I SAM-dependent methyltransferase [Mangrovibacterium lignilyticum]|uniref:class I SAM-dependent methyltransferase n=1 Tax=Mangrovibacterium lignilyticum TaxID=2668052 RepID=UPI0013D254E2|nr:class I SAM-dependent methyltransferase [Mangrovibacterium lignilyticum]